MRAVIQSRKHYFQTSISTVTAGTVFTAVFTHAVDDPSTAGQVHVGAIVKAVYVEYWLRSSGAIGTSGQAIVVKHPGGVNNPTAIEMAALTDWDNKKNILYTTQGLFNDQDADAIPIYKGWVKIPKGKQRQGLQDQIKLHVLLPVQDGHICGFATFKEYT